MRVFVTHVKRDVAVASRVADGLREAGLEVETGWLDVKPGESVSRMVEQLAGFDAAIVVATSASLPALSRGRTIEALSLYRTTGRPVFMWAIDNAWQTNTQLQSAVSHGFIGMGSDASMMLHHLLKTLREAVAAARDAPRLEELLDTAAKSTSTALTRLRAALDAGELTLVCGAGISIPTGLPDWPRLLRTLLSTLFGQLLAAGDEAEVRGSELAALYEKGFQPHPLIMAQYLKNGLGDDFLEMTRTALYSTAPKGCAIVDAVVELCRPQRARRPLRSIVTFNFDDILEHCLAEAHVACCPIYAEGQKSEQSQLPIYHVHGFLPRSGRLTPLNQIVLSEDAYHTQFIDPFSWSNLIQLAHYGQETCVFVGTSLSDPNLRRLLDVSRRKNQDGVARHYVVKRRYDRTDVGAGVTPKSSKGGDTTDSFLRMVETLEETDASNLGLNTIWVDDYAQIPSLLSGIAGTD